MKKTLTKAELACHSKEFADLVDKGQRADFVLTDLRDLASRITKISGGREPAASAYKSLDAAAAHIVRLIQAIHDEQALYYYDHCEVDE